MTSQTAKYFCLADTHLESDFSCVVPRLHASCDRMPTRLSDDEPFSWCIPFASTVQVKSGAAASISGSGKSIFHPSHSDLLVPRRQSAPLDSCEFGQDDGWQRTLNMAGREPSKRVKISRKPLAADRSGRLCSKTHNNSHTSTVEGTRPKEEYWGVHGPEIGSDSRNYRGGVRFRTLFTLTLYIYA